MGDPESVAGQGIFIPHHHPCAVACPRGVPTGPPERPYRIYRLLHAAAPEAVFEDAQDLSRANRFPAVAGEFVGANLLAAPTAVPGTVRGLRNAIGQGVYLPSVDDTA